MFVVLFSVYVFQLEILTNLATEANISTILREFQVRVPEYSLMA